MRIQTRSLPDNCYSSRALEEINGVVLHYISAVNVDKDNKYDMQTIWDLFVELNTPEKRGKLLPEGGKKYYASAHYLVGRDGEVWNTVPVSKQAWHAGKSEHKGRGGCNGYTIGIEVVGEHGVDYTEEQYEACAELIHDLRLRRNSKFVIHRNLDESDLTGHENVAIPKGRKKDPGPSFDWGKLWNLMYIE